LEGIKYNGRTCYGDYALFLSKLRIRILIKAQKSLIMKSTFTQILISFVFSILNKRNYG